MHQTLKLLEKVHFGGVELTTVDMPKVETIEDNAFSACRNLTTVDAPNVKTIGKGAFWECDKLTTVTMPNVKTIGRNAFQGTQIIS